MFFIEIRYSARGNLGSQIDRARGGRASLGTIHSAKMAIGRGEARTNSSLSVTIRWVCKSLALGTGRMRAIVALAL